jgi:hypothetical protein
MTTPYEGPLYSVTELVVFALNGLLEREYAAVYDLVDELTDHEARRVLPVLLTVATAGLSLLDAEKLAAWRAHCRQYLDVPVQSHDRKEPA